MSTSTIIPGSPEAVEAAYYDALNRADIEALMALWADDDNITCIHPGAQRLVGYAAIRAAWEEILSQGGLFITPRHVNSIHNMLTAVHNVIEDSHHPLHPQRQTPDIHILATNVYMKTEQGWRIVLHHASLAPGIVVPESDIHTLLH